MTTDPNLAFRLRRLAVELPRCLLAGGGLLLAAHAQTPAPEPTTKAAAAGSDDATVVLSPFEVSSKGDVGYTVTSSLAGGRVNTELKYTPSVVNVLSSEFLHDIASADIMDAAQFALNVQSPDATVGSNNAQPNFRGLGTSFTTRNYFRWYLPSDRYNTDRIEFSLGPNAMLFGDSNIGGVANTITKRAIFRELNEVSAAIDTEGGTRFTFDSNRRLGASAALRAAGLVSNQHAWQADFIDNNRQSIYLAGTWRPTARTELRFDAEGGWIERGFATQFYVDQASLWDRTTAYTAANAANPTAASGVRRLNAVVANDYLVYDAHNPAQGLLNLRNFGSSAGTALTVLPTGRADLGLANFPAFPGQKFQVGPGGARLDQDYYAIDAYVTQRIGDDLTVELAGSLQRNNRDHYSGDWNTIAIDVNRVQPDGRPNPNYGEVYSEVSPQWIARLNIAPQARLSASYKLDRLSWTRQRFTVMLEHREEVQSNLNQVLARVNGANPDARHATNQIRQRVYWKNGGGWDAQAIPFSSNGIMSNWVRTSGQKNHQKLRDGLFSNQGSYFDGKLHTTLGLRRDRFQRDQLVGSANNPDGTAVFRPQLKRDVTINSASYGTVWFPVRWVGLFANHSESFNPNTSGEVLTINGETPPTVRGRGLDLGVKIEFFESRVSGTVSYYETRQLNNPTNYSTRDINTIWTALDRTEMLLPGANFVDTNMTLGQGWELAITANPTPAWRLLLNVALPKTRQLESNAQLKAYYAQNSAAWRAAATNPANQNAALIATSLASVDRVLAASTNGRANNDTYDYTANFFTTYSIRTGRARGLRFGIGGNLRGRSVQGNVIGQPFNYLYAEPYTLARALVAYDWKWGGTRMHAQLNVTNLLDHDDPRIRSFSTYQGTSVPQNYAVDAPRQATLTVTAKF